jgi:glutamate 5-kinase
MIIDNTRDALRECKKVVIKIGSAIITRSNQDGMALSRMGSIVEQIFELKQRGMDVIIVSSGAVAIGRHQLQVYSKISQKETGREHDKRYNFRVVRE